MLAATGSPVAVTARAMAQSVPPPPPPPVPAAAPAPAPAPGAAAPAAPRVTDPIQTLRAPVVPQADRDEAARRLVQRSTPEARQALAAVLADASNPRAQLAVARAVPFDPAAPPALVGPLIGLIGHDPTLTDAAIQALGTFRDNEEVRNRLIGIALDQGRQQREASRLPAIRAVGTMVEKEAAAALVGLVGNDAESPAVRKAAAESLTGMTGLSFGQDAPQWQRWWAASAPRPDAQFQRELLEARAARLARLEQRFDRVVRESQSLLADAYQTAPERVREQILTRYLRGAEPEVRVVGVQLVQEDFKQNRPIPASAREQLRTMLGDSSARVRASVAQALFFLNDPGAVAALLQQLRQEPDADVRAALAEALAPTRDLQVVEPLLGLLRDPSTAVAEVAADGLRELGPLIEKDQNLSRRVAQELREALDGRTGSPGSGALRSALVEAMGPLRNPELRGIYIRMLRPGEPPPVRIAALRALGRLEQPWAADIVVNALDDGEPQVRLEALNALDTTANFAHAPRLYDVLRSPQERPDIRQRAWEVLRNRFPDETATVPQLFRWVDRFKEEPERRIEILQVLAQRLVAAKDEANLATVRQNIGQDLMKLSEAAARAGDAAGATARAEEADKYFDLALEFFRGNPNQAMITSALLEQRMDALLASRQYPRAADFAASSIALNKQNQEAVGRKMRNEVDRLRNGQQLRAAVELIDAINRMRPPLEEPYAGSIKTIENDLRQRLNPNRAEPQSAIGSGQ